MGYVFSAFTLAYALFEIPSGWLADRFGAGVLGGALTQPLVVSLLEVTTWRRTFFMFGLAGVVWAAVWYWWFRDDPRDHPSVNDAERALIGDAPALSHGTVPWRRLLRRRTVQALCAMYGGTIYGWYFYLTWLPQYLLRARGFDVRQAGWLSALPLVGIAVGVFAGGFISDRLLRRGDRRRARCLPGMIGLPIAAAMIVGAVTTSSPVGAAALLALAAASAALAVAPAWAVCIDIGGRHTGVLTGTMNMFGNLGGALSPVVVGLSLQRWGSWDAPLLTLAAGYLAATACWFLIDPSDGAMADRCARDF